MESSKVKPRLILIAAAGVLVALGAFFLIHGKGSKELTLYGNIDIREVTIGFRVPGRVATLGVDEGDTVRAGQEIARLDTAPLTLEFTEAKASAGSAAARADLLRAGARPQEIEQARANVAERQAALSNAEATLARQVELKGTGAVAAHVYEDALAARDQARARLQAATQLLSQSQSGSRREEIAEADANRARAAAAAAQSEQRLSDAVLRAPADGIVLTRAVEPGAILAAGTPVYTLSLQRPVWARIYVSEPDLGRTPPGREMLVYTDGRPDKPYHGRIGFVSPTAEFTPKNVETPELRTALVYRARVIVADPDADLRQGMPVTVRLAPATQSTPASQ